jgi:hypothetical protein
LEGMGSLSRLGRPGYKGRTRQSWEEKPRNG